MELFVGEFIGCGLVDVGVDVCVGVLVCVLGCFNLIGLVVFELDDGIELWVDEVFFVIG